MSMQEAHHFFLLRCCSLREPICFPLMFRQTPSWNTPLQIASACCIASTSKLSQQIWTVSCKQCRQCKASCNYSWMIKILDMCIVSWEFKGTLISWGMAGGTLKFPWLWWISTTSFQATNFPFPHRSPALSLHPCDKPHPEWDMLLPHCLVTSAETGFDGAAFHVLHEDLRVTKHQTLTNSWHK